MDSISHPSKSVTLITLSCALALAGCGATTVREAVAPQLATVVAVDEWDTCQQQPGAQTRAQRQAQIQARQQASKAAMGEERIDASMAAAHGRPEAAAAVGVGAVQGVGVGIAAGALAGVKAGDPTDIVIGAAAGALAGILLANQDPEECYRYNRVTLRDPSGALVEGIVKKRRDPKLDARPVQRSVLVAFPAGDQGSDYMRPGDRLYVARVVLPTTEKHVAVMPLTPADLELYQQAIRKERS